MRFFAAALFFLGAAVSYSQSPEVPHKMQFAGMTLTIKDDARREIQKDVDALTQHPYYFNMKVERARTYFPIIEKIFKEERLPDDFKYLALQESALISDAVSVSDAVGYWQFKDFTAEEVGMRVDKEIDERMNLISATRGAAKYLKKNNFYFNNWVYALQAYQMGAGGAKRTVGDKHNGAKHMEINSHTYWYVKKYLAHKIAFENALKGDAQLKLITHEVNKKTSLGEIAKEFEVATETLSEYNKWAKQGFVPGDKSYTVLIPQGSYDQNFTKLAIASTKPTVVKVEEAADVSSIIFINEVPAIVARPGDRITTLADRAGIGLNSLLRYNDISIDHSIISGQSYFTEKKKKKASAAYHKVKSGEDLWQISQMYGIQLKRIKKYNRLIQNNEIGANTMLWLTGMKPPKVTTDTNGIAELDRDDEFNWGHLPKTQGAIVAQIADDQVVSLSNPVEHQESIITMLPNQPEPIIAETDYSANMIQHEVRPSDTLYSVSRLYGVTIKQLMEWNEKKDFSVTIGEKLKILL